MYGDPAGDVSAFEDTVGFLSGMRTDKTCSEYAFAGSCLSSGG